MNKEYEKLEEWERYKIFYEYFEDLEKRGGGYSMTCLREKASELGLPILG